PPRAISRARNRAQAAGTAGANAPTGFSLSGPAFPAAPEDLLARRSEAASYRPRRGRQPSPMSLRIGMAARESHYTCYAEPDSRPAFRHAAALVLESA